MGGKARRHLKGLGANGAVIGWLRKDPQSRGGVGSRFVFSCFGGAPGRALWGVCKV